MNYGSKQSSRKRKLFNWSKKGTDALGNPTYSKKSFSNVKEDADPDKVLTVAGAIKEVLAGETRNCYLTVVDQLAQA